MKRILPFLIVILTLSLAACAGKPAGESPDIAQAVSATQTKMAWEASVDAARQTEEANSAAPDSESSQEVPETESSPEAPETESASASPQQEIVHSMVPEVSHKELANTYLTDFNSIDYAAEGITYSDQFFVNRYERPFTVGMAEYRSYLDITLSEMYVTPPWIYVDVNFSDILPESSAALYSLELDLDVDGRGDYLVQAGLPSAEEWTVEGVTVLEDTNNDVGGDLPQFTEELPQDALGDGFDGVVFENGVGEDPDLAWVRRNPDDPTMLQFAFKSALTGNTGFLWSVWADEGLQAPGMRDYNDRFTFEQAGSPYPDHQYYPIQDINLLDSTCRSWYGFEPRGNEANICQIYTPGTGYKLCVTYNFGAQSVTYCDSMCQPECPDNVSPPLSCQKCTLPE